MKNMQNLFLLKVISNAAFFATVLSLGQCCFGAIHQPRVDLELKERTFRLAEEKMHERRQAGGKIL